jgi:hypothetical protein
VKDNIIEKDDIFKYFSLMPPSVDDKRLSKEYMDYIISALAAVFQGHYWQHCPACFKFSKRTNSLKLVVMHIQKIELMKQNLIKKESS